MALKISVSGIRGIIGSALDAESICRWAAAYGSWLAKGTVPKGSVIVARDTRPSGPMVASAVQAALMSTGHDVIDAGILSTPGTELMVQESDAVGGIIVTASHNPVEWNALKLLRADGLFLDAGEVEAVRALHDNGPRRHVDALGCGHLSSRLDGNEAHIEAILALPEIDVDAVAKAKLRVVVDAVEGAGGEVVPALLERMGVEVKRQYCGMSGHFPRDPEPRADHLGELCDSVREGGYDLGLAVDPDVDRLAMVDKGGIGVSEEMTLPLAADLVLSKNPGPMVVNLSTTFVMDEVARMHGVELQRSPVGEANVVARMLQCGAVVGGEGNGGVIYPALHAGRDAVLGAAMVVAQVARYGSLRAGLDRFPSAFMVKEKVELHPAIDDPELWTAAVRALGEGTMDTQDGVKYDLGGRWVHLRRSNTENALRIIAEDADEPSARALVKKVREHLGV